MTEVAQPLSRILIEVGPLTIHWYGFLIGIGMMLGLLVAQKEANRLEMPKDIFVDLMIFVIPSAIIVSRIYYVIFQWHTGNYNIGDFFTVWEGGLAIHGGLLGAFLAAYIYTKVKKISFLKMTDIAAPSIFIGQIIGRWGNFVNQEAHGGEVARSFLESLHLPDFIINQMYINGQYWHPTFLYEAIWNVIGLVILLLLRKKNLLRGEMFFGYLMWYSLGRFFIEFLRTDSLMIGGFLRTAQVVSILMFVIPLFLLIYRRFVQKVTVRYADK